MTLTVGDHDFTSYLREGSLSVRYYGALRSSFFATLHFGAIPPRFPLVGEEIKISLDGSIFWGGILIETQGDCYSAQGAEVTLRGEGYEHLLQRFCLPALNLPEITPSNAIIYILNNYLPQADGLSVGTVDTGTSAKAAYRFYPAKASAIFDFLAQENGYRWWVDKNKTFYLKKFLPKTSETYEIDLTEQSPQRLRDLQTLTYTASVAGYRNVQYVYNRASGVAQKATNPKEMAKMAGRYGSGQYGAASAGTAVQSTEDAKALAQQLLLTVPGTDSIRFTTDNGSFVPGKQISVTAPLFGIEEKTAFCVTETKAVYFGNRFRYTVTAVQSDDDPPSEVRWEQIFAKRTETEMR